MKFILEIDCDNAAFCDPEGDGTPDLSSASTEVARILEHAAPKLCGNLTLRDANGNHVGTARFVEVTP